MKRYLTIAKQVAKEKIGTKDDSVNSDEVQSEREVCIHFLSPLHLTFHRTFLSCNHLMTLLTLHHSTQTNCI